MPPQRPARPQSAAPSSGTPRPAAARSRPPRLAGVSFRVKGGRFTLPKLKPPHDAYFKLIFGIPEYFAAFLRDYLPADILARFADGWVPELLDRAFANEALRGYHVDIVYRIRLKSGTGHYLYIPVEHKSSPDPRIHGQLACYTGEIWKRHAVKGQRGRLWLPPVLPIVVYNGRGRWTVPLDAAEQIQDGGGAVASFVRAGQRYLLCDLRRLPFGKLSSHPEFRSLLALLRGDPGLREHGGLLADIVKGLPQRTELEKGAEAYVY